MAQQASTGTPPRLVASPMVMDTAAPQPTPMGMDTAGPQPTTIIEGMEYCRQGMCGLSSDDKLMVLSALFADVGSFPSDFLYLAVQAMDHLKASGRSNVLYSLAKALGTMRPDGSDSLMPAKVMPMGLIEYTVNFFIATSVQKVRALYLFIVLLFGPGFLPC